MHPQSVSATRSTRAMSLRRLSCERSGSHRGADSPSRPPYHGRPVTCAWRRQTNLAKPAAPGVRIRRWASGQWTDEPDMVVTEEPLQLLLDGEPLSVVMRTPGEDIELVLGLMFSEGILRWAKAVAAIRISAEAGESEAVIPVESVLVESNQVDVHLAGIAGRKPERSMLSSSACGVCGTVMIEIGR